MAAKEFTQEKLSQPFTVLTHMSDAMGQSRLERFYAFVETEEGDLGEQLVRNGLARILRFQNRPSGLMNSGLGKKALRNLRDEAKRDKIGAWGVDAGRLSAYAQTPSAFSSFVVNGKTPVTLGHLRIRPPFFLPLRSQPHRLRAPQSIRLDRMAKKKIPLGNIDINTATEKE